eukprot:3512061-Rhodomonas_salina.1
MEYMTPKVHTICTRALTTGQRAGADESVSSTQQAERRARPIYQCEEEKEDAPVHGNAESSRRRLHRCMRIIVPSARQTVAKGLVRKDPPERNGHEPRNRLISRTALVARREVDERQEKRGSDEEVADVAYAPGPKDRDPDAKAHDAHPRQLHHQPGQRHAADEAETLRAR